MNSPAEQQARLGDWANAHWPLVGRVELAGQQVVVGRGDVLLLTINYFWALPRIRKEGAKIAVRRVLAVFKDLGYPSVTF